MRTALAGRLSRALVGCYPPRWKQRYAEELLDVLDQHRTGPRTVLSLAGGVLSTHLDPAYRMEIRVLPRLGRDTWLYLTVFAVTLTGLAALIVGPAIARNIRESSWHPSTDGNVGTVAFSRDLRLMVSSAGSTPWAATATLWDVSDQAWPRRLSVFEGGNPITISPDGRTVATSSFSGQPALWDVTRPRHPARLAVLPTRFPSGALYGEAFSPDGSILAVASASGLVLWNVADPSRPRLLRTLPAPLQQRGPPPVPFGVGNGDLVFSSDGHLLASVTGSGEATVWDVAHPGRATRIATLAGPRDYFTALAFAPRGNLLAGVTYHGSVLVFRLAGPAGPVRTALLPGILTRARFPGGAASVPASSCDPSCGVGTAAAAAFTRDGHALTVVIGRPEAYPSTAARDTVFTWPVAGSGALGGLSTIFRNVTDVQPTLAPGGRIVADGSPVGGQVHLWALP